MEIRQDFYLATFPVTQEQFAVWTDSAEHAAWLAGIGKSLEEEPHKNGFPGNLRHPAENVSWHLALGFAHWLASQPETGVPAGFMPVLPTEAEWEYACRWRSDGDHPERTCTLQSCARTEYYNGDGEAALAEVGWYDGNAGGTTHAVDEKPEAHPLGLHGLHGNVWEWCSDVWDEIAYRKRPGVFKSRAWTLEDAGAQKEYWTEEDRENGRPRRVMRGGSWFDSARFCRSAIRDRWGPGVRFWPQGFRLALGPGPGGGSQPEQGSGATNSQPGATGDGAPRDEGAESEGAVDLSRSRLPGRPA